MKAFLSKVFSFFVTSMILLMVLMVFTNAVLRYGFSTGIPEAEELSRFLFVWICFMGTVYAFNKGEHVGVTMFLDMMPEKAKRWMIGVGELMTLCVLIIMFWGGISYTQTSGASISPATGIMMGFVSAPICIASLAMFVILVKRMAGKYFPSQKLRG